VGYWMGTIAGISINPRIGTDWWPVCNFAAQETPVDSVFVIPPRRYDFQYYSRRSAFCTFKHLPSALERIPEWFKRLQVMQVIPSGLRPDEISTLVRLDYQAYDDLETEDFLNIKKQYNCVDFCVVGGQVNLSLPLVFENASYRVYRLEPYSPLEIELIRQQVETALEDALLDLRSASIVTEGGETYILAGTGGKMSIEGAVQVADGPWDGSSALVVDDQTRLSGPVTALDLSQGSLSVWARLTDRDKAYSPLVLANKSKGLYVVHKGVHGKLVVLYNDVRLGATSVAITDDQWHHYVLTWRNGEQQFYIDGLRQLSGRVPASVADTELFAIGWMGYKDGEEWEGLLANLTTFDRALSTAEVTTLYWESGSPPR